MIDPVIHARSVAGLAISPADMQALASVMSRTLQPATVKRDYNVAKAIFPYAADRDYVITTGTGTSTKAAMPTCWPVSIRSLP